MKILGIDPGLGIVGYSVVEYDGNTPVLLHSGSIQTSKDKKESARAYMRKVVKRLLRKYEYPPKEADEAVATVIKQAELMSANLI